MSSPSSQNPLRYASLATQWMVMLLIAVAAGYKLDKMLGWRVCFIIVFPLISLCLSLWMIIKEFSKPKK
jgi:F0F1-type ATP synthase assembly protein I